MDCERTEFLELLQLLSIRGFIPNSCVRELPQNFKCFKKVIDNLEEKVCQNIVPIVNELPEYDPQIHDIDNLSLGEKYFMYSILTMIMNRYVWCNGVDNARNNNVLPSIVGVPLDRVSKLLEINPSLTHASVDLWNWHIVDISKPFSLDNIETNYIMTGECDESWFYKVMIAIEGIGGKIFPMLVVLQTGIIENNENIVEHFLIELFEVLKESTITIKRMYEKCDPKFFFNHLRIYLSGSNNQNLPNKITVKDYPDIVFNYDGGSAAQSSLIQAFDRILGIDNTSNEFLKRMLNYMPGDHRKFLVEIEKYVELREYVEKTNNSAIKTIYNKCVNQLSSFRNAHLGLVRVYVMQQIKKNTTPNSSNQNAHEEKGTGGTNPVEFCQEIIDTTKRSIINDSQKVSIEEKKESYNQKRNEKPSMGKVNGN
jgi:indoleamine 2,3-dioxygenase